MLRTQFFQKQAAKRIRNLHQHDDSQYIISDQNGHISKYLWFDFENLGRSADYKSAQLKSNSYPSTYLIYNWHQKRTYIIFNLKIWT